jgi:spermidine/putrescine transport system substrate-binding protein
MLKLLVVALSLTLVGCTSKNKDSAATGAAPSGAPRVVNIATWSSYVSPELIERFTRETGIQVQVSNYSSNEELLAKLQAGASGYDVAIPSDYMVYAMAHLGLIRELDFSKLPNSRQLDPRFLKKSFDPENKRSVPYDWGSTGIAVNREIYKGPMRGWKDLFGAAELGKYKITLLDDVREVIAAALKSEGLSLNTKSPADLARAKAVIMKAKPRIRAFTSEPMVPLVSGETAVAHAYLSDAMQARKQTGGKIEYVIPVEGATLWIDNLVIPTGAANVAEAHVFINFLLDAKSNVSTVLNVGVAPANKEAFALLPKDVRENPALFPSAEVISRLEMMEDLGDALALWDRTWTEIKAGN